MSSIEQTVQAQLFELQDLKYRDFQCKRMPTVAPDTVIGVRTPELRIPARNKLFLAGSIFLFYSVNKAY